MSFVNPSIRRNFFGLGNDSDVGFRTDVRPNEVPILVMVTKDAFAHVPEDASAILSQQFGDLYLRIIKFNSEDYYRERSFGSWADHSEETFGTGFLYVLDGIDYNNSVLSAQVSVLNSVESDHQENFPGANLEEGVGKTLWIHAARIDPPTDVGSYDIRASNQNHTYTVDQVTIHTTRANAWGTGLRFSCTEKVGVVDFEEGSLPPRSEWVYEDTDVALITLTLQAASVPDPEEPEEPDETDCEQACSKQIVINVNCCK